jgi:hypothetical protein
MSLRFSSISSASAARSSRSSAKPGYRNPDSSRPIYLGEEGERLLAADFKKAKICKVLGARNGQGGDKERRAFYSALWQADGSRLCRYAPASFIGGYMKDSSTTLWPTRFTN